ncbi:MAG: hypothetical protein UW83_C0040G0004 [Parcubacteria group bacterium GW2011_GWD1_44_9]|nr:MAG: hypothetical protein UV94_C0007G0038 [Parcubacteria group bacterium GW2011_GWC1_43_30]KKT84641.1 MAG: hypothetical protein UW83_C0040G0004 [Parcubacteria group bacterium GW2011_GWD1_44_9]
METKSTVKHFFLQIGALVCLYAGVGALLNLLFRVINVAFPQVGAKNLYYYFSSGSSISFPIATLIVVFPLFLVLSAIVQKSFVTDPNLREGGLRKALLYFTLFVAGAAISGDLITLVFFFLDGRDITTAFLLKVLSVLVVTGGIFGYYLSDLRGRLTPQSRNIWRIFAILLILVSVILGFVVIGSPRTQRMLRYDGEKITDLQNIQGQILSYWQNKGTLPKNLDDMKDSLSYYTVPVDSQTQEQYGYRVLNQNSFELCADFNEASPSDVAVYPSSYSYGYGNNGENWQHEAGNKCFSRTIDPELYPVRPR